MGKQETMVESVARALFSRKVEEFVCDGTWEENEALHDLFLADARAAIEAMRGTATDEMMTSGWEALDQGHFTMGLAFDAMLTAALNEDSGK